MLNSNFYRSIYLRSLCKLIVPAVILTSGFFLSSCHNTQSIKPTNEDSVAKEKSPDSLDRSQLAMGAPQLYVLYTPADSLLNLIKKYGVDSTQKMVFQFLSDNKGNISLAAFVGHKKKDKRNRKTTFSTRNPLLLNATSELAVNCDTCKKSVLFSNQELNIKNDYDGGKNDISTLFKFLDSHRGVFIIFTPSLNAIHGNTIYQISYQIDYSKDQPQKFRQIIRASIQNISSTNPTPPRNSY